MTVRAGIRQWPARARASWTCRGGATKGWRILLYGMLGTKTDTAAAEADAGITDTYAAMISS
jgi:hypothetical protein